MVDESGIAPDPRIGSLVDERYKVIEAMASGSMGVVYKAERVPVGKLVAIKFLHAPFANDSEFLARFERETRVMSKLTHPNCVSVVDFGVWDGAPYLVMEYVSGTTLRALIDKGPLPPRRALALIRQIAAGLAHAHAQGVVHRDIKPANIMVSEEIGTGDHARILDFGLARLRGAVGRDATQTNVVVGTPNYMAPEQTVGGGLIDARTDIYAAGVVLFEMICGDRPFQAEDTLALLGMHRAAPIPRLADHAPENIVLPAGLQDVVDRAMAKTPSDRFQSAIELADAIDEVWGARPDADPGRANRRGPDARKAAGMAPTVLDISDAAELVAPARPLRARSGRRAPVRALALVAIVAGALGALAWWVKGRGASGQGAEATAASAERQGSAQASAPPEPGSGAAPGVGTAPGVGAAPSTAGSAVAALESEAGPPPAPGPAIAPAATGSAVAGTGSAGPGPEPVAPSAGEGSVPAAAGEGSGADLLPPTAAGGSGAGSDTEMDPRTAEDPAPPSAKPSSDDDEEANAPATAEEVEKHVPAAPVLATTLPGAVQLIQDGKRDLALSSLRALWKKTPNSAYIPFLLGNLYYDRRWWTVAMDHYAIAIKKNAQYKHNPTLNRNVIRMLASTKTSRKAQGFLKFSVGKPALPYLRYAAQHDVNGQVRRSSSWLARNL